MVPPKDDDERERPSWREIDQRRDRAGGPRPARQPRVPKKQAEKERLQALAQAQALFKGKRARPEYQKDLRKLEDKHGTKQFAVYAKKFIGEYGLPAEWGALTRLLDYPDPIVMQDVLQAMAAQAGNRSRVEQQGFQGRLQVLALTSPYPEVRRGAEEILSEANKK
jgi:hypothetical protein